MAGRPKKRIDYAGWSVDIFSNDIKIDKLLDAQGWVGFGVYFYLCQMAFGGEGYYYEWCYDLCASTARKMGGGVGAGTVKEAVNYCLQIGLFDKRLFERWGVLTSRGIQKSYLIVLKSKNRTGTKIYKEYWLLDNSEKEDYRGVVFVCKNSGQILEDVDLLGENEKTLGVNSNSLRQKDSKVKDSKVKDTPLNPPDGGWGFGDELTAAFSEWLQYKQERREGYKPIGLKSVVTQVRKHAAQYGEQAVADLIRVCMASNWQGIIFDRLSKPSSVPKAPSPMPCAPGEADRRSREDMESLRQMMKHWKGELEDA